MNEPAIERELYDEIASWISSPDSPVGIDASKTHVLIIHMLQRLDERLTRIEGKLGT